ncbi:hypothetical protein KRR26_01600 [Corallococcus sp. M34]|uniref:DHHA1 domain-containing protein n=1 Tax=Citreicoccus inhibens TaxID=2849499 RepID=UPI001C2250D0|nr:DHHA1 domain-containing protein [Citreicoccus inhibens]MBU8894277.1 hypothetical protein [Citreicoccus inhibens]
MILYDESNLSQLSWPDTPEGRFARDFLTPLLRQGTSAYVSDRTTLRLVQMDGCVLPLAINDSEYDNSALFSTFSRYITLQLSAVTAEAWGPFRAWLVRGVMKTLGLLLKAAKIDRCVYVDHWLMLRNLGVMLSAEQVRRLTDFLASRYPQHAIVFQAVNPATHAPLLNTLKDQGYEFVYAAHTRMLVPYKAEVSRQVRENRRRDARLLEAAGYQLVDGRTMPDCAPRLVELYRALNGEKYSTNLQFSTEFFDTTLRGGVLEYRLAVKDDRIDGFYSFMVSHDVVSSPGFGYDLSLPQDLGLYRGLVYHLMQEAVDRGLTIELGAGADQFKSLRGDKGVPRYSAVSLRHLPEWRKAGWRLLQRFANGGLLPASKGYLGGIEGEPPVGFDAMPDTFSPPMTMGPREAAAALRQELDLLERGLDETTGLEGEALARSLTPLADKLHNWPQPTLRVLELREKLAKREQEARRKDSARPKAEQPAASEQAQQLLDAAMRMGETALVARHLGDASAQHLRAVVECLRQAPGPTAVVLTACRGEKVVLVTAATQSLLARGVDASQLMAQVAPSVGGKGGGSPDVAWGGGSRPDGIDAALSAARDYLQASLGSH